MNGLHRQIQVLLRIFSGQTGGLTDSFSKGRSSIGVKCIEGKNERGYWCKNKYKLNVMRELIVVYI